jgi:hypothetical protein
MLGFRQPIFPAEEYVSDWVADVRKGLNYSFRIVMISWFHSRENSIRFLQWSVTTTLPLSTGTIDPVSSLISISTVWIRRCNRGQYCIGSNTRVIISPSLPSTGTILNNGTSMNYISNNTLTHYSTKLPKIMDLDGAWEIRLAEIKYPHSWYNIKNNEAWLKVPLYKESQLQKHLASTRYCSPIRQSSY